ncbi:putative ferric reductase transmembrane component [Lachnellula hyalina]|uniref:ferric-chelate reductase (NADPH) n=1 Tax=Lachnellula hyalina TaxID=1316788 RepID=A0A8H8U3Z7_9HELO|nr:putative ferric reductase transmembrane component [Lachnellula hyalina]TVY30564.1 putative ferric reductase transmembrane component [Lachnellula hyalina]
MANATATAAAQAKAAKAKATKLAKILRQRNNEKSAKFFAAAMVGIMVIFILFHWTRIAFKTYERRSSGKATFLRFPVRVTRAARSVLIRKLPLFPSTGHALVFVGYLAATVTVTFTKMDWSTPLNNLGKRLGWISVANLGLVTFLALKNTPLAFLTAYSYERLNVLHRIAGYSLIVSMILHATIYLAGDIRKDNLSNMREDDQVVGIIAGFLMLLSVVLAVLVRKMRYEIFYVTHVVLFMVTMILVGMHRPDFAKKTVIGVIVIGSLWFADRVIRSLRTLFFSFGNTATLTPLSHGGTRVVLRKSPGRAVPGTHCFLWIPGVRALESHPFTISSTKPLELVVAAYDGFTRDLHAAAVKNPGQTLKASIDGPYGNIPNFANFTKVVLIAGGSGASFTVGIAIDLLRKLGTSQTTTIEFIWTVREPEMLEWFSEQLKELTDSPLVNVRLFSTRGSKSDSTLVSSSDEEKTSPTDPLPSSKNEHDIEKQLSSPISTDMVYPPQRGRPDIAAIVDQIVEKAEDNDRVAVAACGPDSLMQVTRRTVAKNIKVNGPSIELHVEQFGW